MFANQSCPSAEVIEAEQPVSVLAYEFVSDKAGAGKFRGGVPFRRAYRFNEQAGQLSVRSDRKTHRPFGLYGGSPGEPSENHLNPARENQSLPSKITMDITKGTVFQHTHPGGGGWGDPLERDPARVLSDVRNEYITAARAEADYGVVIDTDTWTIDTAATRARQATIRKQRGWTEVPMVQRHDPIARTSATAAKAAE
jgi:N-methylhydantoinase B